MLHSWPQPVSTQENLEQSASPSSVSVPDCICGAARPRVAADERSGRAWIHLVNRHGGIHHGYFLPGEGASDRAIALFSFLSVTDYESYRTLFGVDPDFIAADEIRDRSGCVLRYE